MIKAAIIDDGVSAGLYGNWHVSGNRVRQFNGFFQKYPSHADLCYSIIKKHLGKNSGGIQWHNIKILSNDTLTANITSLLKALELCTLLDVKVIHLSIGTSHWQDFPQLAAAIRQQTKRGALIIAATNNRGTITYPACLPQVIGVKYGQDLSAGQYRYYANPYDGIQFAAAVDHFPDSKKVPKSNSFAAPLITSYVLNYLCVHPQADFFEVMKHLCATAQNKAAYGAVLPRIFDFPHKANLFYLRAQGHDRSGFALPYQGQVTLTAASWKTYPMQQQEIAIVYLEDDVCYWQDFIDKLIIASSPALIVIVYRGSEIYTKIQLLSERYRGKVVPFVDYDQYVNLAEDNDAPVILFRGFNPSKMMQLLQFLRNQFIKDGYYCLAASDAPFAKLSGFDVIPRTMEFSSYIANTCALFQCDLLLIGILESDLDDLVVTDRHLLVMKQERGQIYERDTDSILVWDEAACHQQLYEALWSRLG